MRLFQTRKYRARSHWGKSGLVYHDRESLDLKLDYYAREKFIGSVFKITVNFTLSLIGHSFTEAMDKFDPYEIFINNFGRRIKRKGAIVDTDPLTTHCALLSNCICSQNSDCGAEQICTTISGYTYPVCKTINEIPESAMDKSKLPPPFGLLGFIVKNIVTSATAAYAHCSGAK